MIDCGLFHVFSDDDRARYVNGLASVVKPGGKIFMMCFSDKEPLGDGPRRVSQKEVWRLVYSSDKPDAEGALPGMFRYFDEAPDEIYVKAEAK